MGHHRNAGNNWAHNRDGAIKGPEGVTPQTPMTVRSPEALAAYMRMRARIIGLRFDGENEQINAKLEAK